MANYGAADVAALLADFGLPITVGAVTIKGLVDRRDIPVLSTEGMAAFASRHVVVTIHTGTLTGLAIGGAIVVDGLGLIVAAIHEIDDGELTEVVCATS